MPEPQRPDEPAPAEAGLALALGRIPTGLYVVTALDGDRPLGFVGSFLMQVGFRPPVLAVAIAHGRPHLDAIRAFGAFGVSVLDEASSGLMGRFFKKYPAGESAFDGLAVGRGTTGAPWLEAALAWLECRVTGEHDAGDHVVVFGEVIAGRLLRPGDPTVRLRRSGLDY